VWATPVDGGGATTGIIESTGQHAPFTFLSSEDTVYVFSPEDVEQAARNTYRADTSGVVFAVTFIQPNFMQPSDFADVAGEYAWIWDYNATVPGVADIAEHQIVQPLGGLEDVADVAVVSSTGRSTGVLQIDQNSVVPSIFSQRVASFRARLDAIEKGS
jgi:hypothetical protein